MRFDRDLAREAFSIHTSYEQLNANDIEALACYIGIQLARYYRDGASMPMRISMTKKTRPCTICREGGGISAAFIRVDGGYFKNREAVSFNYDGFIGFAGWADDKNVQPILSGFYCWIDEWLGKRMNRLDALSVIDLTQRQIAAMLNSEMPESSYSDGFSAALNSINEYIEVMKERVLEP